MFQKVLATFGSGGAKIDARLLDRTASPGRPLHGEVLLAGGEVDQEIKGLAVTLLARVQVPGTDKTEDLPFGSQQLVGNELIRAGQQVRIPFEVPLPWETPVTSVYGRPLTGMAVGVRAELDLAAAVSDPFDADAVAIEPLPAQKRVLDALSRTGFTFREAILEQGRINGAQQQLPFFQEIRFTPSPRFASVFSQLAVTFLASSEPHGRRPGGHQAGPGQQDRRLRRPRAGLPRDVHDEAGRELGEAARGLARPGCPPARDLRLMATPRADRPHMPGYGIAAERAGLLPWSWAESGCGSRTTSGWRP